MLRDPMPGLGLGGSGVFEQNGLGFRGLPEPSRTWSSDNDGWLQ